VGRKLALVVLGSNIWPIVREHAAIIASKVDAAVPGSYEFIEMPLPPKPRAQRAGSGEPAHGRKPRQHLKPLLQAGINPRAG
jgi:hypothetical protein